MGVMWLNGWGIMVGVGYFCLFIECVVWVLGCSYRG